MKNISVLSENFQFFLEMKFFIYLNRHVFVLSNKPRSLISLLYPHEETLHSWLSRMRLVKIQIRLHECTG